MPSEKQTYLQGGRENQIIRIGHKVHRPSGLWTTLIHAFLRDLRASGFNSAPRPFGLDEQGREILSFIEGEVSNYPLSSNAASVQTLISAAKLLRSYHDASQNFLAGLNPEKNTWQFPARHPQEVICHGDFAPYNVVLDGENVIGMIDFDTCHPGPRTWDIAYALYRWAPFTNPSNTDGFGSIEEQIKRARLFCDAYGLSGPERMGLPNLIIERLKVLINFMLESGLNIKEGHHLIYLADIEYLTKHLGLIERGLLSTDVK